MWGLWSSEKVNRKNFKIQSLKVFRKHEDTGFFSGFQLNENFPNDFPLKNNF